MVCQDFERINLADNPLFKPRKSMLKRSPNILVKGNINKRVGSRNLNLFEPLESTLSNVAKIHLESYKDAVSTIFKIKFGDLSIKAT